MVCDSCKDIIIQANKIVEEAVSSLVASRKNGDRQLHEEICHLINGDWLQPLCDGAIASLDIYRKLVKIEGLVDRKMLKAHAENCPGDAAAEIPDHLKVFDEVSRRYTAKLPVRISPPSKGEDHKPKVSVIVPVYNTQMYICDCLDSILAQTFRDFEVICVDDGSSDASSLALSHYAGKDERIQWIRINNSGIGGARNEGMDAARGEYVLFVDSDDKLKPETLEELVALADRENLDHIAFTAHVFPHDDDVAQSMARQIASFRDLYDIPDWLEYRVPQAGSRLMATILNNSRDLVVNASMRFLRLSRLREAKLRFKTGIIHEDCIFTPAAMIAAKRAVSIGKRYYLRRIRPGSIMTTPGMAAKHLVGLVCTLTEHMETILSRSSDSDTVQALEAYLVRISRQIVSVKLPKDEEKEFLREISRHVSPRMMPIVNAFLVPVVDALQDAHRHMSRPGMEAEAEALRRSEAYRVGMFVTWPLRKAWKAVKHLRGGILARAINGFRPADRGNAPLPRKGICPARMTDEQTMEKTPKVSVVVPVCNVEKYLRQCLDSLVSQSLEDIEIVCVDDGSTDSSLSILEEYAARDGRIVLLPQPNRGYGAAVNAGLDRATGEWIGIVEPDDFVDADMYLKLTRLADSHPEVDVVKGGYWQLYDFPEAKFEKIELGCRMESGSVFSVFEYPRVTGFHPSIWSCIYRRTFLSECNCRMKEVPGAGWVDNPFLLETLCQAKAIAWLNEPIYHYRQYHTDSALRLKDPLIPLERLREMFDFLDAKGICDLGIREMLCRRMMYYLKMCVRRNLFRVTHAEKILRLLYRAGWRFWRIKAQEWLRELKRRADSLISMIKSKFQKVRTGGFAVIRKKACEKLGKVRRRLAKRFLRDNEPGFRLPPKTGTRVMFVASDNNRTSGAFISMTVLARLLRERHGFDVFVVIPMNGHGTELLEAASIPYVLVESCDWVIPVGTDMSRVAPQILERIKRNEKAVEELKKIIRDCSVDIVHVNTTYSYVGAMAALACGTRLVWHLREFLEEDQGNTLWDRERGNKLIGKADRIVAISDSLRRKYEKVFEPSRLVRIFNGIDASRFNTGERTILSGEVPVFIMVGGFEAYKGQIDFARACAELHRRGGKFRVWFVGTGRADIRKECERILNEAGLKDQVTYFGYQLNVQEFFRKADVAFTCSRHEAFGRITVEAMMSGCLVVGANFAGTAELIRHGETGLLFDYTSGKWDDLLQKMESALSLPEVSRRMAAAGRADMLLRMTADRNADEVAALYREMM